MADYDLQYQDTHIDALLATANELKTAGYIYKGVATPSTNPGTPTERVAYLASEPGTYTNFGGIVIASGLYSLTYAGGTWTGTQMSAGSDIEVVQTTGQSTSDVMSQKAVTDEIMTSPQSWDLSYGGDFTWELGTIHNDNGKAWSSTSYYHIYIPVSNLQGGKVKLTAQPTKIVDYAFLKKVGFLYTNVGTNISAYYSSGYNNVITIPAGQEATFVIPNDCNYIYISCGQISGDVRLPQSNSYYTYKWNEELDNEIKKVKDKIMTPPQSWDLSYGGDFTWELGTIHDDGKAHASASYYHLYIPISDNMKGMSVWLKANSAQPTYYAFFKRVGFSYTNQGQNISSYYSSGYTSKITIPAGQEATFVIPNDCNYIYIECGQISEGIRIPQSNEYSFYKWEKRIENLENNIRDLSTVERTIPKVGCGTTIVSRPEDTYAHAPLILENVDYRFIIYQGSTQVTNEDGVGTTYSHVMLVHNKKTNIDKYIKVFDVENKDVIDGNTCTIYYNETATFIGDSNVILIRTGCHLDGKWVQIFKTYNADADVLSSAALQHLSYEGNTFDFNLANYLTMCNTLYGTSLTVSQVRYTNQINNITYYNGKYYCVNALIPATDVVVPHIFMVSDDAITWTPVAMLQSAHSSETQVAIKDDIVYYAYREMSLGTYYMVFDLSGNILKTATKMSAMSSKPTIVYNAKRNKIIVGYNAVLGATENRVKMTIAEISTTNYSLTDIKSYFNSNGWNYFYFYVKLNGNILSVSVEDFRNFNGGVLDARTTTDVRIEEIDLLEILNT